MNGLKYCGIVLLLLMLGCSQDGPIDYPVSREDDFKFERIIDAQGEVILDVTNTTNMPAYINVVPLEAYTIILKLYEEEYFVDLPVRIEAFEKIRIGRFTQIKKLPKGIGSIGFENYYRFLRPDKETGADANQVAEYVFPFAKGSKIKIGQGFNGVYSHQSVYSIYAIDFAASEGTPILAAQGGVVVNLYDKYNWTCPKSLKPNDKRCFVFSNFLEIQDENGTTAYYGHLKHNSAKVKVGDFVSRGEVVAEVGSTGTRKPHLHFAVVRLNLDNKILVEPVKFSIRNGDTLIKDFKRGDRYIVE